jgi:hypothetical protein
MPGIVFDHIAIAAERMERKGHADERLDTAHAGAHRGVL